MPAFSSVAIGKDKKSISKPTHQCVGEAEYPPKYIFVIRDTSLPNAFAGQETWCEFTLPREMGVLDSLRLAVDVTPAAAVPLVPVNLWLSRCEIFFGVSLVETIWGDDAFHEAVGMVPHTYLEEVAPELHVSNDYSLKTTNVSAAQHRFHIPIVSHLTAMRPFVRGFDAPIKVRVYFAQSITANVDPAGANPTTAVTLNEAQLFVCEAGMSRAEFEKTDKQHKEGIVDYQVIIRERQTDALAFNGTNQTSEYLRSFKNDSAGLLVYVQDQSGTNTSHLKLRKVADLTLQDSVGNKLTEQLRDDFLRHFAWTDQVDSGFTTRPSTLQPDGAPVYLLDFSGTFQDTVRTGVNYGRRAMTSQERLLITPSSDTPANAIVNVTSYSYGHIICKNGKFYVQMLSTSDDKASQKNSVW